MPERSTPQVPNVGFPAGEASAMQAEAQTTAAPRKIFLIMSESCCELSGYQTGTRFSGGK
jgi:hypothetical protein